MRMLVHPRARKTTGSGLALLVGASALILGVGCHRSPPPVGSDKPQSSGPPAAAAGGGGEAAPSGGGGGQARPLPPGAAEKGELPPGHPPLGGGGGAAAPAGGGGGEGEMKAPVEQKNVSGTIDVSAELSDKVKEGDVMFVFASMPVGGGPPLVVKRVAVTKFPMEFSLGPQDLMIPNTPWSGKVKLHARVSKAGDAMKKPGDIEGHGGIVDVGATGIKLVLNKML
jgi:hypothetical protein